MFKHLLAVGLMIISFHSAIAQQSTDWSTYYEADEFKISFKSSDCDYPEKGVHNRYLLLKLENLSDNSISVSYDIDRSYNGKEITPDKNGYYFNIPATSSIEAKCDNLEEGLHLFVKVLNVEAKSNLSAFELSKLTVNGKNVAR